MADEQQPAAAPPAEELNKIDADLGEAFVADENGRITARADRPAAAAPEGEGEEHEEDVPGETPEQKRDRKSRSTRRRQQAREHTARLEAMLAAQNAELQQLRERSGQIADRVTVSELARIDAAAGELQNYIAQAEAVIQGATQSGDVAAVARAVEGKIEARNRLNNLVQLRQRHQQAARQVAQPSVDPTHISLASAWHRENSWYNPEEGVDEDSDVTRAIDRAVRRDGFDPRTQAFWHELDRRLQDRLPHRYGRTGDSRREAREDSRPNRAAPPMAASPGREGSARAPREEGWVLSRERVQMLKDTGKWDDPQARARAIKSYQEYDRQQSLSGKQ